MATLALDQPKQKRAKSPRKLSFEALCQELTDLARQLGPGAKLPTMVELCSRTGVSVMTLDRALGELVARNVIVRKNGVGIFVSPNIDKRVISLACDPTFFHSTGASPFWNMLVNQARNRAEAHNEQIDLHYMSIVGDTLELPFALRADIAAHRVNGIIYNGNFEAGVNEIEEAGVPVVVFSGPGSHIVEIDFHELIRQGAELLARQGCRKVALWTPDWTVISPSEIEGLRAGNAAAFRAGLDAGGAPYMPELVRENHVYVNPGPWVTRSGSQDPGYRTAMATFSQPRFLWPDGIVISDDMMTLGALAAMQEAGVRPGVDVMIATHGNRGSYVLNGWYDKIKVLEIDPGVVVATMLDVLERLMNGDQDVPSVSRIGLGSDKN